MQNYLKEVCFEIKSGCFIDVLFIFLGTLIPFSAEARKETEQEDQILLSASLLAALSQKGLIRIIPGDKISVFVQVELLYWKELSHIRKQKIVQAAMNVTRSDNKGHEFVIFQDMTTSERLATGYLKNGKIKIIK